MNWKEEINKYYEDKKNKNKPFSRESINVFFESTVMPALNDIENCLSVHVNKVRVKRHVYKATLIFSEKEIHRSAFHVKVNSRFKSVDFPFELNNIRSSGECVEVEDLGAVDEKFIIERFMCFFRSREEKIQEWEGKIYEDGESYI